MKTVIQAIVKFIRREWFLLIAGGIAGLIIYIFEQA